MNIRAWAQSRFLRVVVVGGIGVLSQTVCFEILGVWLRLVQPSTAVLLSAELGTLTNFYLNNRFSFQDRGDSTGLLARLVRFHITVSGSVILQWLFVFIVEHQTTSLLFIHAAYVAGIVLGFAWNYTLFHLFVWRRPKESSVGAVVE